MAKDDRRRGTFGKAHIPQPREIKALARLVKTVVRERKTASIKRKPVGYIESRFTQWDGYMAWDIPIKVISEANQREHWRVKWLRQKKQKTAVDLFLAESKIGLLGKVYQVRFTRFGVKALDTDNLSGAFKAVRDMVASKLGVNDGDPSIKWETVQVPGNNYGIRIEIYHNVK